MATMFTLKKDVDAASFKTQMQNLGFTIHKVEGLSRVYYINSLPPAELVEHPSVESVEDGDAEVKTDDVQEIDLSATNTGGNWALARTIRRRPAWRPKNRLLPASSYFRCARDGDGVDVYICDTGIIEAHSEFSGRATIIGERVSSGGLGDDQGHGTRCLSQAIGLTVGIARAALGFSVKVLDSSNSGTVLNMALGIGDVISHFNSRAGLNRPAVLNLSLGADTGTSITAAIEDAIDAGIVVCCAAGNGIRDMDSVPYYPTMSDVDIISVGGLAYSDQPYYTQSFGTNHGSRVSILSPAQRVAGASYLDINSIDYNGSGTSYGCPMAVGTIATYLQGKNRLTTRSQVQAVKAFLEAQATTGMFDGGGFELNLPDRILYCDPDTPAPLTIPGL